MITRRNFLKAGAAVAALSVVPNGFASILAKKEKAKEHNTKLFAKLKAGR